jgi:hypothetical protein
MAKIIQFTFILWIEVPELQMFHSANDVNITATALLQSAEVQAVFLDLSSGTREIWTEIAGHWLQ